MKKLESLLKLLMLMGLGCVFYQIYHQEDDGIPCLVVWFVGDGMPENRASSFKMELGKQCSSLFSKNVLVMSLGPGRVERVDFLVVA